MKREAAAFAWQRVGRGQVPHVTGLGSCPGPCCCFVSWSKSSVGSGGQHGKWMGKFVLSCISSSPPCAAMLRVVRKELGVGPRGARARGGTRGSAGVDVPMGCCSDPHNLAWVGRRGAGRKGECHGSCPAKDVSGCHTQRELWPRKTGSSLPPSPVLVRCLPLFTRMSALVYQGAVYSTGHDFTTSNTALLFKWGFQMFFIVCQTCCNLCEYIKQQERGFTILLERLLNRQPRDACPAQAGSRSALGVLGERQMIHANC